MGGSRMIGAGAVLQRWRSVIAAGTALLCVLAASGCATTAARPKTVQLHVGTPEISFGTISDTQIQNRQAWAARNLLRSPQADRRIPVTIRPPVLDLAARTLLRAHLDEQQKRGVSAIFYLGDGANQGCISELASTAPGDEGIFPILAKVRQHSGLPIFFVLGNHDFLAAGNTENQIQHAGLCGGESNIATKAQLIRMADDFNRASAAQAGWTYRASTTDALEANCSGPEQAELRQSRRQGCFYAATLDVARGAKRYRFVLLDTNDYADVSRNRVLRWGGNTALTTDFEGLRGAISFREATSQTSWLAEQGRKSREAGQRPDVLVALTHYNITDLRRMVKVPLSRKTQLLGNVFVDQAGAFYGERAFVVSAHTHTETTATYATTITEGKKALVTLDEVNIGSTTDHPSLSAVLELVPSPRGLAMAYEPITLSRAGCEQVRDELAAAQFPRAFLGNTTGGRAIAFDAADPLLYHQVTQDNVADVFANIDWFIGSSSKRAICLGLMASAIEADAASPIQPPQL